MPKTKHALFFLHLLFSLAACLPQARLLAADRPKEAARCYENAKKYGATPDPELEKSLGPLVNQRAELADFLAGAAAEAEKNELTN